MPAYDKACLIYDDLIDVVLYLKAEITRQDFSAKWDVILPEDLASAKAHKSIDLFLDFVLH